VRKGSKGEGIVERKWDCGEEREELIVKLHTPTTIVMAAYLSKTFHIKYIPC
jgi:hypothetical protein